MEIFKNHLFDREIAMLNVLEPHHDMAVAVIGVGAVGLAAIMSLKLLDRPPRKIIAVDIIPERLELARRYGATHGVNSKVRPNLMEVMLNITDGHGIDGSIDTTGNPSALQDLLHSSARRGKIVSVGVGKVRSVFPQRDNPNWAAAFQRSIHVHFRDGQLRL